MAACRRTARLGLLLALAAALYIVEAQLPTLPVPGARLGLANLVSVLALYGWGLRETLLLGVLRQVLGGALTGALFGMPFYFGMAGTLISAVVMHLTLTISGRRAHPAVVSLTGAIAHNMAQLGVAYAFIRQPVVLAYLPYLLYFAIPAGLAVGYAASVLLPVLADEMAAERLRSAYAAASRKRMLAGALAPAAVALICVTGLLWATQERAPAAAAAVAKVAVNGVEVARLPLDKDAEYEAPLAKGRVLLRVRNGRAAVVEASCPDQICVGTGEVERPGQGIVCVPNRVSIEIVAVDRHESEQGFDAVTW